MNAAITDTPVEPAFARTYEFPFDPFQLQAMAEIRAGRSVMVAAPTSAGKTVVAEYALWRAMSLGTKAIYTTPIKALSNQKRRDLEQLYPGQVGLLTGDRSERPEAPIVVMTTEVLRNMLVDDAASLDTVGCIVFDEVHYLADLDRGTIWEEAIINSPDHVQLVCLSATIQNADEIAAWITETHRPIALIRHDERPVPLDHYFFSRNRLRLLKGNERFPAERVTAPAEVLRALGEQDLLPAIWFAFSRRAVEETAEACAFGAPRLNAQQKQEIETAIAWTLDTLPTEDRTLPQLSLLVRLLRRGVGFHHAGLLPPLKELVERLFIDGLLSVVCATDTLAVGINMPARTVIINSLTRPVGGMLTPNDFQQLTGRAGRRGIDPRGAVVMLPSPSYEFHKGYAGVTGPLQPVLSAFRLRYSSLLSAMEGSPERLARLVKASLRQYQMKGVIRKAQNGLATIGTAVPDVDEGVGTYLKLQTELSAAEKEQKRARSARSKNRTPNSEARLQRARDERARLSMELREHPLHASELIAGLDPGQLSTLRDVNKLKSTIDRAQEECDQDAAATAEAVRTVLRRLGYLDRHGLRPKARGLRQIVSPSGIVLAEMYDRDMFKGLKAPELVEVMSWFASDSIRRRPNRFRLGGRLLRLRRIARDVHRHVSHLEEEEGIHLAQGPSEWFYGAAQAWAEGSSIGSIASKIGLGEGDIVSLLNKTVDLLDQFEGLLLQHDDRNMLAVTAEARRLLVRGLVAMVRSGDESAQLEAALS
ncbi:MAG: DEAD/DEAH box helicase [Chloroflexota bacterium]